MFSPFTQDLNIKVIGYVAFEVRNYRDMVEFFLAIIRNLRFCYTKSFKK